ncbi:MAG: type I 3-dehydroquinate dehydratase [Clostridiaceae bacterium]|jgi:3-dehydroquinate dehydratase|nr:type I 3-dehydroquinate dehydratase [Clostridiaceae bacterium]
MKKITFLNYEKPLLTAMIQCPTKEEAIAKIKKSIDLGADAIGVQLCKLKKEYRTLKDLKEIFDSCNEKPIYITSYRFGESTCYTDEQCVELLLLGLEAGATLCDVMGDMFDPKAHLELSQNPAAIKKQMELIDEIHRRGGEVLMSSHTRRNISIEEAMMIAKEHDRRGADIIKIVTIADHQNDIPKYIECIQKIIAETNKKLLFLASGKGTLIRYIGPNFGVCMYLCVESHGVLDTKEQPLLSKLKLIRDNFDW